MAKTKIVAVLGRGVVAAQTPVLRADDLGVLRGDGVFETMHLRAGQPWQLNEHLGRMARSAGMLDLDLPGQSDLTDLAMLAAKAYADAEPDQAEGSLRLVCTRGPETAGDSPTVFAIATGLSPTQRETRGTGLAVRSATLGVPAKLRPTAPWLLAGAKTTSYAMNLACQRWAAAEGADDVLWVSVDGYALEAPTSSLVWLDGDALCTVPPAETGVLAGTTASWLLDNAAQLGWRAEQRMITLTDLASVEAAWLTSSVRGAAQIRSLDGVDLPASGHTGRILRLLGFPA